MNIISRVFNSSLGKKYVMAITGLALVLFVIAHLLGNLQIFLGPEALNRYGHFLQTTPELLWPARIGLLLLVGLHIYAAARLSTENRAARGAQPYEQYQPMASSYASRTMLMSGLIIAAFVIYHLLHFTIQAKAINLTGTDFRMLHDAQGRHDVYRMVVIGFSNPWVVLFYVIGVGLLCLHLSHGVSSLFQSLGWKNRRYGKAIDTFAKGAAIVIFLGYLSIPLSILLGLVK